MSRLDQLNKLLELDPKDTFVLYGIAQEHAKAGDHALAVEFYARCLAVDDAYLYAYFHKARSLDQLGRQDDARACLAIGAEHAELARREARSEILSLMDELA